MAKTLTAEYVLGTSGISRGRATAAAEMGKLNVDAEAMGDKFDKQTSRIGGLFSSLGNQMGNFGLPFSSAVSDIGGKLDESKSKATSFGKVMSDVGGVTLAAGVVGIAGAAGESVKLAVAYQTSAASLQASAGITTKQAKDIGDAFLATGGKSTFSAQQIMTAYAPVAAQLGEVTGHALSAAEASTVMSSATDLAEASGTNLATATSSLATVMQVYGLKASGAASASNTLYNAAKLTGNSVTDVAGSVDKMHAKLGAATPALSDVAGLMLDLNDHGVTGSRAMSTMSSALTGLIDPTAKVQATLQQMGVTVTDANGKFVGSASVIAQLQGALGKLPPTVASTTAATKAQTTAIAAQIAALQGQLRGMTDTSAATKLSSAESAAATKTQTDAITAQITQLNAQKTAAGQASSASTAAITAQVNKLQEQKAALQSQSDEVSLNTTLTAAQATAQRAAIKVQSDALSQQITNLDAQKSATSGSSDAIDQQIAKLQAQKAALSDSASSTGVSSAANTVAADKIRDQIAALENQSKAIKGTVQPLSQASALQALFGKNSQAMLSVIQAGPSAFDKATDAVSKTGSAQKAAAIQAETLHGQAEKLKASLEDEGVKIGEVLIPKLEELEADTVKVINWFMQHKTAAEALAGVIGGALSIAVGAFAVNKIGSMISSVSNAVTSLGKLESGAVSAAKTVLEKFGLISTAGDEMESNVDESTSGMTSKVDANTKTMATKAETNTSAMATGVEGKATGMETDVGERATGMSNKVKTATEQMATKAEANTTAMAATTEATTAGMATTEEAETAGMATKVEAITAAEATQVEAETESMAVGVQAILGPLMVSIAAVYAAKQGLDYIANQSNKSPGSQGNLTQDLNAGDTQALANAADNALAAAMAGGAPKLGTYGSPGSSNDPYGGAPTLANPSGGQKMLPKGKAGGGGLVTQPSLIYAGETGKELILDPDQTAAYMAGPGSYPALPGASMRAGASSGGAGGSGGAVVNVFVAGSVSTEQGIVQSVLQGLQRWQQVNGSLFIGVP